MYIFTIRSPPTSQSPSPLSPPLSFTITWECHSQKEGEREQEGRKEMELFYYHRKIQPNDRPVAALIQYLNSIKYLLNKR
jgi:hypothetical protein